MVDLWFLHDLRVETLISAFYFLWGWKIASHLAHPNYVKTIKYKILHLNTEQSSMFQISSQDKYTHLYKMLQNNFS